MAKFVASSVKATASGSKHPADLNKTGKWVKAGQPIVEQAPAAKSEQGPVLLSATASFTYLGGSCSSPPIPLAPIPSTITLKPKTATKLSVNGQSVLLEDDEQTDAFGNKLFVSGASGLMKSGLYGTS
ncbi:hypothetical protein U5801_21555 [Lamprobacter modestohalophilus]|uniref:hypothetical protein n=1 Tax=Lamprobacter modestohalophilus TaxID=1064514 RepID=UPI002ADEC25D|nr:hypothetical protein [Lamprobacter modestohalophilus]MEA1052371.1 hypothetical protein [Lamprobacter modestohalophilus]